jgi:hypothetical protein
MFITLLLLIAGLGVAQSAAALDVHGRSSTQYIWYNAMEDGSQQAQLAEYLSFSMNGIDSSNKLSLQGYGRLNYDLKNGGDVRTGCITCSRTIRASRTGSM